MKLYSKLSLLFYLSFVSILPCLGQDQTIQNLFDQWTQDELLRHASIGFYATDAQTGQVLAQSEPQLSLVPASTMKLVTTAAALNLLGENYRFETQLAYSGQIQGDTLLGDLIIVGGGDPALGSKYFKDHRPYQDFVAKWAKAIRQLNIRHITGNIRVDLSRYESQSIPNSWIWEDMGNYYGAGVFALSAYDNLFEIHMASPAREDLPTTVTYTYPLIPKLEFDNQVLSSNINRDRAYVFGSPLDSKRVMRGTIPKGKDDFTVKASIPNPPYLVAYQLEQELGLHKVEFNGELQLQNTATDTARTIVARVPSPPLSDIVDVTNHESVNLFAETLMKEIAYQKTGFGSTEKGTELIVEFWEEQGMNTEGLFMVDGSGLSRFNVITAEQLGFLLQYMKTKNGKGKIFFGSLPSVPNGTLWYFNPSLFPKNSLLAKSGSMTRVRSFAGQLTTRSGETILFAIILNNFGCSQMKAIKSIEKLLAAMQQ